MPQTKIQNFFIAILQKFSFSKLSRSWKIALSVSKAFQNITKPVRTLCVEKCTVGGHISNACTSCMLGYANDCERNSKCRGVSESTSLNFIAISDAKMALDTVGNATDVRWECDGHATDMRRKCNGHATGM